MTTKQTSAVNIVFGAMTIGKPGVEMTRVHTLEATKEILDIFQAHGHYEIDTARVYGEGSSEEYLAEAEWQKRGLTMDTKLYPSRNKGGVHTVFYSHTPEDLRRGLQLSLQALKCDKIDMWYLHGPDRAVPYKETLREVNNLYKEGHFNQFGISNYMAWEVAQICEICEQNGWIKPTVYQGVYHTLQRVVEPELFPCLRHYGIAFYCFQPLAGGFLTHRYTRETTHVEEGCRFDPKRFQGQLTRGRYWNDTYFDALEMIRETAKKHNLTEAECAMRWLMHHSLLKRDKGDAVIVGASSAKQLEENLVDCEKGPLPEEVLKVLDDAWLKVKGVAPKYWH